MANGKERNKNIESSSVTFPTPLSPEQQKQIERARRLSESSSQPLTLEQKLTLEQWKGLIPPDYTMILRLLSESDRAEASVDFLYDHSDRLKALIATGRNLGLTREQEKIALREGMHAIFPESNGYNPRHIDTAVNGPISALIEEVADTLDKEEQGSEALAYQRTLKDISKRAA